MPKKPIDLEAVRRADEKLQEVLAQYPELRAPNPEREAALADWLSTLDTEDTDDAEQADRSASRPSQDERV